MSNKMLGLTESSNTLFDKVLKVKRIIINYFDVQTVSESEFYQVSKLITLSFVLVLAVIVLLETLLSYF